MQVTNYELTPILDHEATYSKGFEPTDDPTAYKIDNLFIVRYLGDFNGELTKANITLRTIFAYSILESALFICSLGYFPKFFLLFVLIHKVVRFFESAFEFYLNYSGSPEKEIFKEFLDTRADALLMCSGSLASLNAHAGMDHVHPKEVLKMYEEYLDCLALVLQTKYTSDAEKIDYATYSSHLNPSFLEKLSISSERKAQFKELVILPFLEFRSKMHPDKSQAVSDLKTLVQSAIHLIQSQDLSLEGAPSGRLPLRSSDPVQTALL